MTSHLSVQLLEEEISDMGKVLARVSASEANLLSQVAQLEEAKARLSKALEDETKAKEKAQLLIKEYEKGVEKRCAIHKHEILEPRNRLHTEQPSPC